MIFFDTVSEILFSRPIHFLFTVTIEYVFTS